MRFACNWRHIDEGVALSGQGLRLPVQKLLRHERVRAVLNLRGENPSKSWYRAEVADCAELGIAHHNVRLSSRRLPERHTLRSLLDAFDTLDRPMLMKCAGGVDRSMFAAAIYRLNGSDPDSLARVRADLQRQRLRHLYRPEQRWIRAFPDFYDASRGSLIFRDWIETVYSAGAFEDYLMTQGLAGSWRARPLELALLEPAE
jgi:protein tyrosine phosphatase (PTP) superfamily phosphohydrolase (DUF442 family)